jgi:phospholipid-translocating ATPase
MSTICRIGNKIVLYCKGADTIIKERLSPECLSLFEVCEDHLNKFAEDALRTLCLAWKEIGEDEYRQWAQEYHEASTSLDNRAQKVSDVYEKIESNLLYIGATAIEDKLQDGVPECIAKLAKANIKIWVLTGDKLETAMNIGYSCQLLTNDMEVFTIEANSETDLMRQVSEKRRIIDDAQKRMQLEKEKTASYMQKHFGGGSGQAPLKQTRFSSLSGEPSSSQSDLYLKPVTLDQKYQQGMFMPTIPEAISNDFALVISGQSLVYALNGNCEKYFLDLGCLCKAVICCRVTPGQKKAVVDLVKTHKKAITLAIGDGANDVSMIKSAHIGVGISGQEGQQAVLASDFSIGQFRYLERLLLVHGRWSYYRISKFLRYFFYKNFASTLCHFWFAFFCGFSAQVRDNFFKILI